ASHKGNERDEIDSALDAETDLIRLPQVVHVADASAFASAVKLEERRSVVAHAFDAADYTDENEITWLAAEIDTKLEASRELTKEWCDRLKHLAHECGFKRVRLWLVTREGFSPEAEELLNRRDVYGSSRQQVELLTARIVSEAKTIEAGTPDEYEMVI